MSENEGNFKLFAATYTKVSLQQNFYFDEQNYVFEHLKKAKTLKIYP